MRVMIIVFLLMGNTAFADDFHTRLIVKLSEMMRVEPPKMIIIERLNEKSMLDYYRNILIEQCLVGASIEYCANISVVNTFIHGIWIREDKNVLHIKAHRNTGVETYIHEFVHWYLNYSTNPNGLLNTEEVLKPIVDAIIVSPEFISWLETEEQ